MKNLKNILLIVVLLIGLMQIINAQTNVSGGIFSNTTWTAANSPYIVTDTVVVFPSVTLTIQPGVTVKFANNKQLEIRQGKLIAQGTASDSITFTSNSSNPVAGIWGSVYLNNTPDTTKFYYCNFNYAQTGISGNLLKIRDSKFSRNSNFGITAQKAFIDSCEFTNHSNFACQIGYGYINSCNLFNNNYGLYVYDTLLINNCKINFNQTGIYDNSSSHLINIQNSEINYNQLGIFKTGTIKIINSEISHNYTGITDSTDFPFSFGHLFMKNCIVDSNNYVGLNLIGYSNYDSIMNCQIKYNGIGLQINGDKAIKFNQIENNLIGVKCSYNNTIICNKICNNTDFDFYNSLNQSYSIAGNYWCTTDSVTIASHIYDGHDNINSGLISFLPLDTTQCYLTGCDLAVTATITNATCDTCHNGSAIANVVNGFAPYTYTWYTSPLQTTQTATGLSPGTYTLCVTDGNGCSTCNHIIYIDSTNCTGFSINAHSANSTCSTCSDGSAWVSITAGTAPFHYTWYTTPMQNTDTVTNLLQGGYMICVNDLYGCSACDSAIIETGDCSAHFNLYPDTVLHHYIAVNMASGIPPLTYVWNWGDGYTDTTPYPNHNYSSAGFYAICLTITDSVGCTSNYCNSFYLQKNPNTIVQVTVIPQNTTGIQTNNNLNYINIFPSPALDYLTVKLHDNYIKSDMIIYNLIGQLKFEIKIISTYTNLNISSLKKGIYIIELIKDDTIIRKKFIKQ